MNINANDLNLEFSKVLAEFVKFCLLQNRAYIKNSSRELISVDEVLKRLNTLKKEEEMSGTVGFDCYSYGRLSKECAGAIDFSDSEINEISNLVGKSVAVCGLERSKSYWDVITFAIASLDRIVNYPVVSSSLTYDDYDKAIKWGECLRLEQLPLYYKPFACIISCGYPDYKLRIASDDNKTLYEASSTLGVVVNELADASALEEANSRSIEASCDAITTAVDWWAKAFTDPTFALRYCSSPSFISSVLALAASRYTDAPSEESIEVFKDYLGEEIRSAIEKYGCYNISVSSNYELDPALSSAIQKSRVGDVNFSWQASMDISPEEVSVTLGNNKDRKKVLYDAKNVKSDAAQKVKA